MELPLEVMIKEDIQGTLCGEAVCQSLVVGFLVTHRTISQTADTSVPKIGAVNGQFLCWLLFEAIQKMAEDSSP